MKLVDLLKKANSGYPDGFLSQYFDAKTGEPKEGSGDTLARFIVAEIRETYDKDANEEDQLDNIVGNLEKAVEDIQSVIAELYRHSRKK